ncbi:MAG: VWA domain-containing protein, partial [Gammaproteobacteria bacterium]|nr:VWA domain-containing protein [Gammaproteobacteria bacterium]
MNTVFVRLFTLVHISAVALLCVASGQWSTAIADDTEVFFSTPASQGGSGSANVLLFLDNSDSMNIGVEINKSRGEEMVEGTVQMIESLTGVDVGLATFNGNGASILQPMRPLDSPALGSSIYYGRVDRSGDDAALDADFGRQGLFVDFPQTAINTPLAPVYIRQRTGDANPHPVLPSVQGFNSNPVVVIETVVLKTDVASFDDSVSPSLVGSPNPIPLDVIETSNLTLPGSAG